MRRGEEVEVVSVMSRLHKKSYVAISDFLFVCAYWVYDYGHRNIMLLAPVFPFRSGARF